MTPAQVLRAAAGIIRERGWIQGTFGDVYSADAEKPRRVCMFGACNVVVYGDPTGMPGCQAEEAVWPFLRDAIGTDRRDFWYGTQWNDKRGRTVDEVIAVLERAAGLAEAQS
jgi:hypothetical protein